eukprot:gnl/MRDRNA2_/MRDRNA2_100347_c0_seq1.p1 gnl/MRDRNA2_/MRDRNA2_100347_c0~~gnl/MRDRNA2_/MRDRNA2_100347_c0_seq1.p1  ORF type:complete len:1217 (+),score=298.86 gnl/MRDRNA2_/MRDRNA2_100347_c0_seq1:80-3730(+)
MAAQLSHGAGRQGKTIEEIYQKKTQLEHILLRPDSYVGSIESQTQDLWVLEMGRLVHKKIQYVPALYKIFDEIIVNAADNSIRDPKGMDTLEVTIDKDAGTISVMNNGKGLPVVMHKEHQVYVPEMVFGQLLTSDNYNDSQKKVVGGRNGYGAKLTNIFSTVFTIETADGAKKFKQVFTDNMGSRTKPEVIPYTGASFTRVTFKPDFKKFGMQGLDDDIIGLMSKRVYDMAATTHEKVSVSLNGEKCDVKTFQDYVDMYLMGRPGVPHVFEKCGERWEIAISLTEGTFQQVSFVNSINTIRGGTHVTHVADQVVEDLLEKAKAKSKEHVKGGVDLKAHQVKNHIWVFVKCLIENPAFDSQTKDTLTTKVSKFGSRCEVSQECLNKISESGVIDLILTWALAKSKVTMAKNLKANTGRVSRLVGVPKLEDANDAGGPHSSKCTLILTEGDSAKALAVAGLSVVGRDRYGVFPLRGKVLNVRDATFKQMMDNKEIQGILKIMGLNLNISYDEESMRGLRYGSLMIMTDQDFDGSHIKGLLINLIHAWWPSLAKAPGFLKEFVTPIVKVKKGKTSIPFFTIPEYEKWQEQHKDEKGWSTKYYKGLGTSTTKEAKEYFRDLDVHKLDFKHEDDADDKAIDLAFNKKRADDRKEWINAYEEGTFVDHSKPDLAYKDFVNKELVLFAKYSTYRAVPSMMDGFKPGQRKVLFGCFKRKLKNDIKVAQLTGYVSEHSAYHHGESALQETIIGLAQNFVGSNNVNLLVPSGQFGTRLQGGKDAASARYIYTHLSKVTRMLFREEDDAILQYQNEEGQKIEPVWYAPIVPWVLVNGAEGIGTGWATSVPNYNPRDIISNIRRSLKGQELQAMVPWYRGFNGKIEKSRDAGRYDVSGKIQKTSENTVEITELPVRKWTQDYRELLEDMCKKSQETKSSGGVRLEDYKEYHTETLVHFVLTLSPESMKLALQTGLERTFKLHSSISTSNMMLFNSEHKIIKFDTPVDIIKEFIRVRLPLYQKRKDYLLRRLGREAEILTAKTRFILMVVKGELVVRKRKIAELLAELLQKGFKKMSDLQGADKAEAEEGNDAEPDDDEDEADQEAARGAAVATKEFEYLLGMPLQSLTYEKVQELKKLKNEKVAELQALEKITIENMWLSDLADLEAALDERDAADKEAEEAEKKIAMKQRDGKPKATEKTAKKRKGDPSSSASSSGPSKSAKSAKTS